MKPTLWLFGRRPGKAVTHRPRVRRRAVWATGIAVGVLLAAAAGSYLTASAQYRASGDERAPLASRLAAADAAGSFWPLSASYRARVATLRGLSLLEEGDILGAYDIVHAEYVREVIAERYDPQLVAVHARVYQMYLEASSRAAHVMHGKEQPDGTILPEDVQHFPRPPQK